MREEKGSGEQGLGAPLLPQALPQLQRDAAELSVSGAEAAAPDGVCSAPGPAAALPRAQLE